jgi:hypothetical protein
LSANKLETASRNVFRESPERRRSVGDAAMDNSPCHETGLRKRDSQGTGKKSLYGSVDLLEPEHEARVAALKPW